MATRCGPTRCSSGSRTPIPCGSSSSGAGFLGALIAGFVAGYIVNALKKVFADLPHSLEGIKPVLLYPLLGVFLVGVIMIFVINPPVAGINNWMIETLKGMDTSSRILIGALMGGESRTGSVMGQVCPREPGSRTPHRP